MNEQNAALTVKAIHETGTVTRLPGYWAWVARVVWIAGFLTLTIMYVLGIFAVQDTLSTVCEREPCTLRQQVRHSESGEEEVLNWPGPPIGYAAPLRPEQVEALEQLGLTLEGYGWLGALQMGIPALIFLMIAGFLFWQKSDDWMVLFVSIMAATFPLQQMPLPFILQVQRPAWGVVNNIPIALMALLGFPLIFPTGRFVPRWTRWYALVIVAGAIVTAGWSRINILGIPGAEAVLVVWLFSSFLIGAYAQLYRYFRVAAPAERQQLKLVIAGLVAYIIGALLVIPVLEPVLTSLAGDDPALEIALLVVPDTLWGLHSLFIPGSIALSVLRYRLWDIDLVINRSLVYGGLTVLLGLVLAGGFFGLRALMEMVFGSEQVVIAAALSGGIIVALFNPARRALRRFVDRRFYGIEIEYATPARQRLTQVSVISRIGGYTDLTPIGSGGMGEVYRAHHPALHRSVAIKVLPPHAEADDEAQRRFQREARTVARLKHPNIVTLHDVGEEGNQPFMVMEFVDGPTLSSLIRQQGRFPLAEALPILKDVAGALDYAHSQGVIHRDIKPSNVMVEQVTASGQGKASRAVLMDFGIAKSYAAGTRLTQSGMVGTLDYIAPEQIQGAAEVDHRADIYALGVMAYQMLTGELPFRKNNPGALVLAHLLEPPPDACHLAPDLPHGVCAALQKAMAKKPTERFESAGEMVAALA